VPTTADWIKKKWTIYTLEYDSAMKKGDVCHWQENGWNWRSSG
jgi:hypothetical protein